MNVSISSQMAYENKRNRTFGENKPNQSQFPKGQNERKIRPHPKKLRVEIKLDFSNNDTKMPNRKTKISNSVSENKVRNDCKTGHTHCRIGFSD